MSVSSQTCVVLDHGMFLELALRLGRDMKKVYYACPWAEAMARYEKRKIGEGYDEIERVEDFYDVIDECDFAVWPDVYHGAEQRFLKDLGIPIWGSLGADDLECRKLAFKRLQEKVGAAIADYEVIDGLDGLRDHCRSVEGDRWIKMTTQYRGNCETFHHRNYISSRATLDRIGMEFGICQDELRFISEKPIKSEFEGGVDSYIVEGKHPKYAVQGWEKKDLCYFAVVQPYDEIPKEITSVNEYLFPMLAERHARQFVSTEVKILKDKSVLLEPTIRLPSPAGEEQMELYGNLPEIISEGSNGRLVEPELTDRYACEAMIEHTGDKNYPSEITIPEPERKWIKLYKSAKVGNRIWIGPGDTCIGAVVGVGKSPRDALEHLKENAACLEDQPVIVHTEAIVGVIDEIEKAEDYGIHFSDKPLPEPAEVVSNEA